MTRRSAVFTLLLGILPIPTPTASAPTGASVPLERADSLYREGRFEEAETAFAAARGRDRSDTLVAVRRASLSLLRNRTAEARAILDPLLARHAGLRSALALRLESCTRDLDFAAAAPLARALGREAFARQLESFAGTAPFRLEGPARVEVPFLRTDPLPLLEVRLDGRGPYHFLVDTGGGDLLVDPEIADSLGLPRFGSQTGTFGGGRRRDTELSRLGVLQLGDVRVHDVPVTLLDCRGFSAAAGGRRVAGIVGTRVLMRFRATLDYPGGRLVLARRGVETPAGDSARIELPMWLAGDHYLLARGRMNEAAEALWFLDTGLAGAGVTAPEATLAESGIAVPDTSASPTGVGGGGRVRAQLFPVGRFRLGPVEGRELAGVFGPFPPSLERAFGFRIAGIVSHAFFRPMRVTFDFDTMRLILDRPRRGDG